MQQHTLYTSTQEATAYKKSYEVEPCRTLLFETVEEMRRLPLTEILKAFFISRV